MKIAKAVGYTTVEALRKFQKGSIEIHLVPALGFSEKKGIGKVIIGGLKLVAAFFLAPYLPPDMTAALVLSGLGDIVGGVAQALSPQPKMNNPDEEEKTKNRYLGAPSNTVGMGVRIPRGYGTVRVGGHFLSFNTDAIEVL